MKIQNKGGVSFDLKGSQIDSFLDLDNEIKYCFIPLKKYKIHYREAFKREIVKKGDILFQTEEHIVLAPISGLVKFGKDDTLEISPGEEKGVSGESIELLKEGDKVSLLKRLGLLENKDTSKLKNVLVKMTHTEPFLVKDGLIFDTFKGSLKEALDLVEELFDGLEFSLQLRGRRLRQADPVPLIINQLQELVSLAGHKRSLFTILTELYVNALDHGVLGLDSALKHSEAGFSEYFSEREKALEMVQDGHVKIKVEARLHASGGKAFIRVEDSGNGFDISRFEQKKCDDAQQFCGRGMQLVNGMCDSLSYEGVGNIANAVYSWEA